MNKHLKRSMCRENTARNAWFVFGGLLALGVIAMAWREAPSVRREIRLMRM